MKLFVLMLFLTILFFLFLGCLGLGAKDCKNDKDCLRIAFAKCESAHGFWQTQDRVFEVQIIERSNDACKVSLKINESLDEIGGKELVCLLPVSNQTFDISANCSGTLKPFYG